MLGHQEIAYQQNTCATELKTVKMVSMKLNALVLRMSFNAVFMNVFQKILQIDFFCAKSQLCRISQIGRISEMKKGKIK